MRQFLLFLLFVFSYAFLFGSEKESGAKPAFFIQPEFIVGKTLHAHSDFPQTRMQTVYALNLGKFVFDPGKLWAVFYNYPSVGLSITKSSFGNDQVFGNAYTIMPYLNLNLNNRLKKSFHLKLGLGASYFTNHYDKVENPNNKSIGSTFTWTFESTIHYTLLLKSYFSVNIGAGFIHHSNGHTQLPNLGLNSFVGSISTTFYFSKLNEDQVDKYQKPKIPKSRQYFMEFRSGLGMHELGDETTPLERLKKTVISTSVAGGIIFKRIIKLRAGLTYRFYQHYYNYITTYNPPQYSDAPVWNASNFFIYVGCELLMGHIGMDTELGLNVYKPFYKEHSTRFEKDSQVSYTLKKVFASRLGLKVYAFNTIKNPRNNFFLGVHINANMGQADFSELSVGVVHRFKKIYNR